MFHCAEMIHCNILSGVSQYTEKGVIVHKCFTVHSLTRLLGYMWPRRLGLCGSLSLGGIVPFDFIAQWLHLKRCIFVYHHQRSTITSTISLQTIFFFSFFLLYTTLLCNALLPPPPLPPTPASRPPPPPTPPLPAQVQHNLQAVPAWWMVAAYIKEE